MRLSSDSLRAPPRILLLLALTLGGACLSVTPAWADDVSFHFSSLSNGGSANVTWSVLANNQLQIDINNTGNSRIKTLGFNDGGTFTGLNYISGASGTKIQSNHSDGGWGKFDWSLVFGGNGLGPGMSVITLHMAGVGNYTAQQIDNGIATDLSSKGQHTVADFYKGHSDLWITGTPNITGNMTPEGSSLALLGAGLLPLIGGLVCSKKRRS
jgi:hypothetical protein